MPCLAAPLRYEREGRLIGLFTLSGDGNRRIGFGIEEQAGKLALARRAVGAGPLAVEALVGALARLPNGLPRFFLGTRVRSRHCTRLAGLLLGRGGSSR